MSATVTVTLTHQAIMTIDELVERFGITVPQPDPLHANDVIEYVADALDQAIDDVYEAVPLAGFRVVVVTPNPAYRGPDVLFGEAPKEELSSTAYRYIGPDAWNDEPAA